LVPSYTYIPPPLFERIPLTFNSKATKGPSARFGAVEG
jgi:hypothetical protein